MGWSSGLSLAEEIWDIIKDEIPEDKKQKIANAIVCAFEGMDCDCLHGSDLYHTGRPTCFISGHLDLTPEEFEEHYKPRIDEMIGRKCNFVVGDAPGTDTMAQEYLNSKDCRYNVMVVHMFDEPRNYVNNWWDRDGGYQTDEDRDAAGTAMSDIDIAWVRPGRENSGTAKNLKRRKVLRSRMSPGVSEGAV